MAFELLAAQLAAAKDPAVLITTAEFVSSVSTALNASYDEVGTPKASFLDPLLVVFPSTAI
jgi:hypothetical protein